MRRGLAPALTVAALAVAGCGGGGDDAATPTPTPTPTVSPAAPPEATPTAVAPSAPSPPPDSPEDREGGAGDEEAARVPVDLTVSSRGVRPATVAVPGFLALELRVTNDGARPVTVTVERARAPNVLTVRAGRTGTLELAGLRPGRYRIDAGAAGRVVLVAGVEAGP